MSTISRKNPKSIAAHFARILAAERKRRAAFRERAISLFVELGDRDTARVIQSGAELVDEVMLMDCENSLAKLDLIKEAE